MLSSHHALLNHSQCFNKEPIHPLHQFHNIQMQHKPPQTALHKNYHKTTSKLINSATTRMIIQARSWQSRPHYLKVSILYQKWM